MVDLKEYSGDSRESVDRRSILTSILEQGKTIKKRIEIKVYCAHKGCNNYIKGYLNIENGLFFERETGLAMEADMVWFCHEHLH